ncbi:MAG: hypothetical protein KJP21_09670, partial [Bacteroidia bacterium]|nr:hypothetical protein [Bacteroidia bacterium]
GTSITPYITSPTASTGIYSCLGSNPIGQVFLKLPKIAPNQFIIVKWKTKSCCPTQCNTSTLYNQRWRYNISYENQCGNKISPGSDWGSLGGRQSMIFSKFTPSDISDGQTKQWEYTLSNGYLMYPTSKSQLQVELVLPPALTHSLSSADLKFEHANGSSWTPNRFTQTGNTVVAYFNGYPTVTLTRSELLINIKANCSGSSSNSSKTYQVNISYITDTTCTTSCAIPIYCDVDQVRIHCSSGCNSGLHFTGFDAKRISVGLPDNDNDGIPDATGSIDYSKIKTTRIMYGDTLLTTFKARVNNAGSITNWYYGKATSKLDYGRYLSVASANLKIYRGGNILTSCNNVPYSLSTAGISKTYTFDISVSSLVASGCGIYGGFSYISADSFELEVQYVVDLNIGNQNVDLTIDNDFYLSSVANPQSYQKYQCDSFSARVSLMGWYFTNYGRNNLTRSGCGQFNVSQNFYLSIGKCCSNYAGGNIFPFEYRKWAQLKEVFVLKDPGFDINSARIIQYRTKGTGGVASQNVPSISPYFTSPTEYRYRTDSLYSTLGGNWLTSDDGFHGTFTATLTPNCLAENGLSLIKYGFVFNKLDGLGSGTDTLFSTTTSDQITYEKPNLQLTITNPYVYAVQDTVEWKVRVTNASSTANALNAWLGSLVNNNTEIVAIYDVASGTNLTKTNDVFQLGTLNQSNFKDLIVKATYNSCNPDSINLQLGYDCLEYPSSISDANCENVKDYLFFEPINTRLEANIIGISEDVDLCAENEFNILLRNTGSPKIYDTYLDIILRSGMKLGDSAWLYVDGRSDSIFIGSATDIGSSTFRWELSAKDSSLLNNGMNGVNSSSGYTMTFKFKLKTDCDFTSSTSFLLRPGGRLKCGTAVNAPFTLGDPINIKGVVRPYFSALDFQLNHIDVCNYVDSTFAKFLNLGPDTTRLTDSIVITFPSGVWVDTAYIDNSHNSPIAGARYISKNGLSIYKWGIPKGIIPGDSCVFIIKTSIDNSQIGCGIKQVYVEAVSSQLALCVETNTYCSISVATSSLMVTDSVEKGQYMLDFNSAVSTPNGSIEDISLSYDITNSGANHYSGSLLECSVYYDLNGNGIIEPSDSLIAIDSIQDEILSGNSISRNFNFSTSSAFTCNLLLYIGPNNCVCSPTTLSLPAPQLLNAGNDTTICPGETITIGSIGNSSNTYQWNNSNVLAKSDTSTTTFFGTNPTTSAYQYEMVLTTSRANCSSSDTMLVNLYPAMDMNMADSVAICVGDQIVIGENVLGGTGRIKTYSWYPSDSLDRTNKSKTFAYPITSTTYFVDVSDDEGCSITDSIHIKVIETPIAAIEVRDTCIFNNVFVYNKSDFLGEVQDSVHWDFADLGESTFNNAVLYLDSSRIIPIHLYVQNSSGCWDTTSTTLEVYPEPIPIIDFTSNCENLKDTIHALS